MNLPPRLPTKEEWDVWLSLPQTAVLFALASIKKQELQEAWGRGSFTLPSAEATAMKQAEKIGEVNVWARLLELEYQTLINEIGDEYGEHFRASAGRSSGPSPDLRAGTAAGDHTYPRPGAAEPTDD